MPIKLGGLNVVDVDHGEETRECGDCQACCIYLSIEEEGFSKKPNVRCSNLANGACGCTIYETRPEICKQYYCMYKLLPNLIRDDERPDKVGVLLAINDYRSHFSQTTKLMIIAASEMYPGAFDTYHAQRLLKRVSTKISIALITNDRLSRTEGIIDHDTKFLATPGRGRIISQYLSLVQRAKDDTKKG